MVCIYVKPQFPKHCTLLWKSSFTLKKICVSLPQNSVLHQRTSPVHYTKVCPFQTAIDNDSLSGSFSFAMCISVCVLNVRQTRSECRYSFWASFSPALQHGQLFSVHTVLVALSVYSSFSSYGSWHHVRSAALSSFTVVEGHRPVYENERQNTRMRKESTAAECMHLLWERQRREVGRHC